VEKKLMLDWAEAYSAAWWNQRFGHG
jgi:hypothetical protein